MIILPVVPVIFSALRIIPKWQVTNSGIAKAKDLFEAENEARKTLAQIVGGAAILIGLIFTWKTLQVDKEGQITERFTRAIEQLGTMRSDGEPNFEVRVGGIYALERIAKDSPQDHWTIMEVLTTYIQEKTYVQENAPCSLAINQQLNKNKTEEDQLREESTQSKPKADIQAILNVIGRSERAHENEKQYLNLKRINLQGAQLYQLYEAHLGRADLRGACLVGVNLRKANLGRANLRGLAKFWGETHLENADLKEAYLGETDLCLAFLNGAELKDTCLEGASLQQADLRGVKELAIEQICKAKTLYKTNLNNTMCYVGGKSKKCEGKWGFTTLRWDCWEGGKKIKCFDGVKTGCPKKLSEPPKEKMNELCIKTFHF